MGNATQHANWNAKYSAFYVTRHSPISGRQIQVGKPHRSIESALAAAKQSDGEWMTFIDVVKPGA